MVIGMNHAAYNFLKISPGRCFLFFNLEQLGEHFNTVKNN